ncbi:caspase family protein [Burkholderia vietnamiensis]|uniref:caspase family protein n=1 Tax=Burkholderia vietnamiensis TaxID=60552 RepID=UPI0018C49EAE|nr:caspase family protein [Burkholderia vietnamiensis]
MTYILPPTNGDSEPGIHILLVGVDNYPHLHAKDGSPTDLGAGFNVLDAPSYSSNLLAQRFAAGDLRLPDVTVKSIDVLSSRGTVPLLHSRIKPENPTFDNVRAAIERWYALGEQSEENLLVFYFCGHGLQHSARSHSLLCADFGSHKLSPFDHAIDYEGFESGMRTCAASRQIFLIDTCRASATELTNQFSGTGRSVVARRAPDDLSRVSQSVLWATAGGAQAWAPDSEPSVFASAFLQCLRGAGAELDIRSGATVATAASIQRAMAAYLWAVADVDQEPQTEQPIGKTFTLHEYGNELQIPIVVRCNPEEHTPTASLSCLKDGAIVKRRRPYPSTRADRWVFELPQGDYTFRAVSSIDRQYKGEITHDSFPPLALVRIPIVRK